MRTAPTPPASSVRPATRADLAFVAWCNQTATTPEGGPCYWDALLGLTGTPTPIFLRAVYALDALAWGRVEDFLVVEQGGLPVAGGAGFEMGLRDYRPLHLERLEAVADHLGWSPEARQTFLTSYERVWPDPHDLTLAPAAPWVLECIAVRSEARGQRLTRPLLNALIEAGRQRGHDAVAISVTLGNEAAMHAYEGAGFRPYMTYGAEYFEDAFPGSVKYRLRLHPHLVKQERSL